MKKKTNIRTLIRKIVREEVAMAIGEVITELKQPNQQVLKSKPKKKVVEGKRKYQKFTKNSVLNDILNETAQSDDWKTLAGETFDSTKMNQVMSSQYGDLMNGDSETVNADAMVASMGKNPDAVSETLKDNMFNKDYGKVLKAMDKAAKKSRGI